jgi:hypothetical protein
LVIYERIHIKWIRNKALEETLEQMKAEDRNTKYICIGPVNKAINMLCMFYAYGADVWFGGFDASNVICSTNLCITSHCYIAL